MLVSVLFVEPFTVGIHTAVLHIAFQGQMYVGYYTFTVDGVVISEFYLSDIASALVVADATGAQVLYLEEKTLNGGIGFEKIADETTMMRNPVLTFTEGILFWTMPNGKTLLGFDIIAKSAFSQTLNTHPYEENIIELQTGSYGVAVASTSIDFEFKPDKI